MTQLTLSARRRFSASTARASASRSLLTVCALGVVGSGCGGVGAPIFPFDPEEATIANVRSAVKTGFVSCRELAERYQLLHDELDVKLHTTVTWNDHLLADADKLDQVPLSQRGSFHCVPVMVKDNINVAGFPTTAGVLALAGGSTPSHADAVQRLLTAGALIVGKSNMPDFALDGTNTKSSIAGQTLNPYRATLSVYGSSGGTASAISASLGIVGLGTDTLGSLVQPASATGLVAIRATQGLVPSTGVLPLFSQQDVVGPMTRTVEDAAAVLALIVDKAQEGKGNQNYTSVLKQRGLSGLTIGFDPALLQPLATPLLTPSVEVSDLFYKSLSEINQAGATTRQVSAFFALFPSLQASLDASFQCMPVDFKQSFDSYLANARPDLSVRRLSDVIATGKFADGAKAFLQGAQAQTDTVATSAACKTYLAARDAAQRAVVALLDKEGLDLLVYPAANQPVFPIGTPPSGWFGFHMLSSSTGLPSLSMPMGITPKNGAPVGLIMLARPYQEAKLIQAAYAFQQQSKARKRPTIQ